MAIQRYLDGIGSVDWANPIGMLPYLDPTKYCVWFTDFNRPVEPTTQWLHTTTAGALTYGSTGGTGTAIQTLGGLDNDLSQLALRSATFAMTSAKKFFFEAKVTFGVGAGTINQQERFVGMSTVQVGANFVAADGLSLAVDDCIGFWSPDGSADMTCVVRATDVQSIQQAAFTAVAATAYVLSIYFDGTTAYFYKDDTLIGTLRAFPTAAMTPTLFIKAGEAQVSVLTTDYVLIAVQR